jgi:hypothetical protein
MIFFSFFLLDREVFRYLEVEDMLRVYKKEQSDRRAEQARQARLQKGTIRSGGKGGGGDDDGGLDLTKVQSFFPVPRASLLPNQSGHSSVTASVTASVASDGPRSSPSASTGPRGSASVKGGGSGGDSRRGTVVGGLSGVDSSTGGGGGQASARSHVSGKSVSGSGRSA